jgi:hypothetical protein
LSTGTAQESAQRLDQSVKDLQSAIETEAMVGKLAERNWDELDHDPIIAHTVDGCESLHQLIGGKYM